MAADASPVFQRSTDTFIKQCALCQRFCKSFILPLSRYLVDNKYFLFTNAYFAKDILLYTSIELGSRSKGI